MSRILASLCVAGLAISGTAAAQTTNPATVAPGNPGSMSAGSAQSAPGVPAPNQTNNSDRLFSRAAAVGGMAEVEAGRLAARTTSNPAVRQFGERMVQDHSQANKHLADLAAAARISLPSELDAEHRATQQQLSRLQGAAFDHAYILAQVVDHQQTAQLLEYEIGSGEAQGLKSFASETLPVVLEHLALAQRIQAQLTGAAAPAASMDGTPVTATNTSATQEPAPVAKKP
jgi:putative membrane protein